MKLLVYVSSLLLVVLLGCVSSNDVNLSEVHPYSDMLGKEYELLSDCFVFRHCGLDTKYSYIAPINPYAWPYRIDKSKVGKSNGSEIIVSFIKKGQKIKIIGVYRTGAPNMRCIDYVVKTYADKKYQNFYAFGMFSYSSQMSEANLKYIKPVKKWELWYAKLKFSKDNSK